MNLKKAKSWTSEIDQWVMPLLSFQAHYFAQGSAKALCGFHIADCGNVWEAGQERPLQFCSNCRRVLEMPDPPVACSGDTV